MKNFIKHLGKGALAFILVFFLGFVLLFFSHLLPSERIALHVRESGSVLQTETDYWVITHGDISSTLDNFTDAIMLLSAGYTGDGSLLEKTVYNYRIYEKGATKGESCLVCGILTGDSLRVHTYEWYWQGFQTVLKPLLLFFNLTEIRNLNMFVIISSIVLICLLLHHRKKTAYILPYITALCFLNLGTIFMSLQYSTIFHLASVSMIVMLLFYNNDKFRLHIWMYFMIIGMCTSYFDFLTYPIMVLGFSLILYFILSEEEKLIPAIGKAAGFSSLWFIGYLGMWASKWILASLVTGTNQISKGLSKFQERSSNTIGETSFTWVEMMQNMKSYLENGVTLYLVAALLFASLLFILITKSYRQKNKWITSLMLLGISVYPFIWYTIAANHSMQHSFFTFKSMAVFVFGFSSLFMPYVDLGLIKSSKV
ncbi:hypothetical protein [Konateibacter massiliensis]|uniref:hypothetical protein n=1 Tax=Konateibacter massiliensis TaxID=2002841 RepID=UPI000C14764E|nr:hypothetical protein [Konateibacter massiliensis]